MLYALTIQSFVLIDRLHLEAADGFTALTGETGAGKSIILDAIGLVLGGAADRKQVRAGADQAGITAEFSVSPEHPAWRVLDLHGLDYDSTETLVLRRTLAVKAPSRAFVNGQPVAASVLAQLGALLVEIHGQHAAAHLLQASTHLDSLDAFAGHQDLVTSCAQAWHLLDLKRTARRALEDSVSHAIERRDWLTFAVEDLSRLAPEGGELESLGAQRGALLQSERISDAIKEAAGALRDPKLATLLTQAAKAVDRIIRVPGLETLEGDLVGGANAAAEALERTLIELAEAQAAMADLSRHGAHDAVQLEGVETRLFALRAAARKYDCLPELLSDTLQRLEAELALCSADCDALDTARAEEAEAETHWRAIAEQVRDARHAAASDLEATVERELAPLHLDRVKVRVAFKDIDENDSGARGLERAEFEVQTNPGAAFGALKAIASGGELARFSLAMKCALSQTGDACTLIFDEADQGVGGAVAAAIGERLSVLARDRQVFAVTHSPQVASAATRQWRVMKEITENDQVISQVAQLDDGQRLEEIARMLSGSSITNEARAAALKLLEAA
jgi:DNA repair protein RecN (Recombination protein N)